MNKAQKNSSTKLAQKLEAPVALTPDQIAMVAAGAASLVKGGSTATSGIRPASIKIIK